MTETRAIAGTMVVAVAALFGAGNSCRVAAELRRQYRDPYGVEAAEQRFAVARERLGAEGVVGYISDLGVNEPAGMAAFLAAQYALAPRLLGPVDRAGPEWAVGNFARPADIQGAGARAG
jgi:hypothetical protein